MRQVPQITAADGVDTTFFGSDVDGNGLPNFFGTSAAAPDAAAVAALVIQSAGGPGSIKPAEVYSGCRDGNADSAVDQPRPGRDLCGFGSVAAGDWTRWARYFRLERLPFSFGTIASVTFDLSARDS